jgi:hypothetical protein
MTKQKFILYTNPNNITNYAYVAYGTRDVNRLLHKANLFPDSYLILYSGRGTDEDISKAKRLFPQYKFTN